MFFASVAKPNDVRFNFVNSPQVFRFKCQQLQAA